jgi:hypothetical protein
VGLNGVGGGERRSRFHRICVYCGSAKGRKPSYQDAAVELGKELVRVRHGTLLPHLKNPAFTVQQTNKKKSNLFGGESPPRGLVLPAPRQAAPHQNPARLCCCHLACLAPPDCAFAAVAHAARPWVIMHPLCAANLCSAARRRGGAERRRESLICRFGGRWCRIYYNGMDGAAAPSP